jgi:glycerophosphoryl diester phosphodiesterase
MLNIAHRGASGHAPENTLAAFEVAAEMGADAVETDLRLTLDGTVVALHDADLQRTTGAGGMVAGMTAAEIRGLDAAARWLGAARFAKQPVPTLEQVLRVTREKSLRCYLEIKATRDGATERAVVEALRTSGAARHVVISFDEEVLRRVRQIEPALTTGLLTEKHGASCLDRAQALGARQFLPREDCVTESLVAAAKAREFSLIVWTVDDPTRMLALIKMGVAGIITNYPDRLASVIRNLPSRGTGGRTAEL